MKMESRTELMACEWKRRTLCLCNETPLQKFNAITLIRINYWNAYKFNSTNIAAHTHTHRKFRKWLGDFVWFCNLSSLFHCFIERLLSGGAVAGGLYCCNDRLQNQHWDERKERARKNWINPKSKKQIEKKFIKHLTKMDITMALYFMCYVL